MPRKVTKNAHAKTPIHSRIQATIFDHQGNWKRFFFGFLSSRSYLVDGGSTSIPAAEDGGEVIGTDCPGRCPDPLREFNKTKKTYHTRTL